MAEVPLPTPTQVPVPSTDIRNAVFAGAKLDEEVTGAGEFYTDRLGVQRLTNTGRTNLFNLSQQDRESRFNAFIQNSGYKVIGDYTAGPLTLTEYNQLIRYNNELYKLTAATDIPFTTAGNTDETWTSTDAAHFVSVGDAALRQNLGSDEEGMGTWLSFHVQKGMVKQTLNDFLNNSVKFVTPFMFKSLATDGNWSAAIAAADAKAAELGLPLMGFGQVFSVSSLALISGHIEGINFIPHSGYSGAGPTLTVNQTTGRLYFKGSVKGFISSGVKVIKGGFTGIPTLTLDNTEFSYNGNLIRTTCVNAVNTASDYVIPVASATGFAVGNFVWIGDSKCTIASISGNTITLVNDGTKPILLPGGEGTGSYAAGQFLTKDGDGKNGITIGSGGTEQGWNLNIINGCKAIGNGWFGVFHYVKAIGGNIYADGSIECANNGYCGLGLSYIKGGKISGFNCYGNGNNGLDIFETTSDLFITDGVATGNGVDGVFASGNGTAPKISKVKSFKNFRIGILAYGRSSAPIGYNISDCECTDNGLNDVCYTGVRSFNFRGNTLGGAKDSLKIEGRNGLLNPDGCIVSENVFTKNSTSSDITANVGGYTSGGDSGRIFILNNYYNGRTPSHTITNFNRSGSRFSPAGYLSYTPSYSATTGATISVSIVFYKPNTLNNIDILGGSAEIQICSNPALLTAGTVSGAVRTAGIELSNGGTTTGKILAMAAFGTLSYNFTSTTAKTVYLNVKTDHGDVVITLTWSD